jgi:hypothetical protein
MPKSTLCLCAFCFHARVGDCNEMKCPCCTWYSAVHKWLIRLAILADNGFWFYDAQIRRPDFLSSDKVKRRGWFK